MKKGSERDLRAGLAADFAVSMGRVLRVIVVGARRARQGIGEFVARSLHIAGARVVGIVGTRTESVEQTRIDLRDRYGIDAIGYTRLDAAIDAERPDAVAICSPYEFHREQLDAVAGAGAHCLCEKPMWWPRAGETLDVRAETERIVESFASRGTHLELITQWPCTLPYFYELFPALHTVKPRRFDMRMGPISTRSGMVLDAAPHVLSMLQGLVGHGEVHVPRAELLDADGTDLRLEFEYRHTADGDAADATQAIRVRCRFTHCAKPPRPASYAIDGCEAHRGIRLPEYTMYFEAGDCRVEYRDPLDLLVEGFLDRVEKDTPTDGRALVEGVAALETLTACVDAVCSDAAPTEKERSS